MMIAKIFEQQFHASPQIITSTSGRVNLIGEHTDYNGGMVLPALIEGAITIGAGQSTTDHDQFYSDGYGLAPIEVDDAPYDQQSWWGYARGALEWARSNNTKPASSIPPLAIAFESTIPAGSGLSSSAAMLVGILKALREMNFLDLDDVEIALGAQYIENNYMGVPCGIMDQMAVSVGKPDMALALDTGTLAYHYAPLDPSHDFIVVHSGVTRKLTDGRYKDRRIECEEARERLGVEALCTMSAEEMAGIERLPDRLSRRARHAYTEHRRVIDAINALNQGDMILFGQFMLESHASYRDDFEASTPEIDELVVGAIKAGALGARLTGGGFGGCIVACVEKPKRETFESMLSKAFPRSKIIC